MIFDILGALAILAMLAIGMPLTFLGAVVWYNINEGSMLLIALCPFFLTLWGIAFLNNRRKWGQIDRIEKYSVYFLTGGTIATIIAIAFQLYKELGQR